MITNSYEQWHTRIPLFSFRRRFNCLSVWSSSASSRFGSIPTGMRLCDMAPPMVGSLAVSFFADDLVPRSSRATYREHSDDCANWGRGHRRISERRGHSIFQAAYHPLLARLSTVRVWRVAQRQAPSGAADRGRHIHSSLGQDCLCESTRRQ